MTLSEIYFYAKTYQTNKNNLDGFTHHNSHSLSEK